MRCKSAITEWYKSNWSNDDAVIDYAINRPRTGFLGHNFTNGNDYRLCIAHRVCYGLIIKHDKIWNKSTKTTKMESEYYFYISVCDSPDQEVCVDTGVCIYSDTVCDGQNNCGDWSDELDCGQWQMTSINLKHWCRYSNVSVIMRALV